MLHRTVGSLKHASDLRCRLCRIIYHTPTEYEHSTLLHDEDEPLEIVLHIDPSKGTYPVLSVEFCDVEANVTKIPRRTVASCSGLLNDGKLVQSFIQM